MIELRREETAIAAPPMQEQHVRITLARRVEHNPCRASLSDGPGPLSFSHSHRFVLGVGLDQEPKPQPGVAASGNTPSPKSSSVASHQVPARPPSPGPPPQNS